MAVSAGVSNALERNWGMVDRAIDGLSDETLAGDARALMKIHSHSGTNKEGEGGGAYIGAGVTVHSAHACAQ